VAGARSRVLILDEPTRGIDVGANLRHHASAHRRWRRDSVHLLGATELLELSDRVLVMRRGRIVAEFRGTDATEENVMPAAVVEEEA
jgi:ABC-type sugar transport system ATPase subunit